MAGQGEERYLEWLDRMEQEFGVDDMLRMSEDWDYAYLLLQRELGWYEDDPRTVAFLEHLGTKYEGLPELGISFERVEQPWGFQSVYRDIETGRFIARQAVTERIAEWYESR